MARRGFLLLFCALSAACGQSSPSPTAGTSGAVARVAGTDITQRQFDLRLTTALAAVAAGGAPTSNPAMSSRLRASVVRGLIFDTVIAQEAAFRSVAATATEINAAIAQAQADAGGATQLQTQLAAAGQSADSLRDQISARLNEQKLEDYYAKDRAATLLRQLDGGADFATVATKYSDSPDTVKKGGLLGTLSDDQVTAQLGAGVLSALGSRTVGQYTEKPVRTRSGYEIVRVEAITPAGRTLREILVAAPDPYTVRERPAWFGEQVFQAIYDQCRQNRIQVFVNDPGADPCAPPTATAAPAGSATPSATATP